MEDQFDGVDAVFEMLLEEIRRSQESLKQAGSKAFADGDLPRVGTIRDKLERLETFLGQVSSLRAEWQKSMGEQRMGAAQSPEILPCSEEVSASPTIPSPLFTRTLTIGGSKPNSSRWQVYRRHDPVQAARLGCGSPSSRVGERRIQRKDVPSIPGRAA